MDKVDVLGLSNVTWKYLSGKLITTSKPRNERKNSESTDINSLKLPIIPNDVWNYLLKGFVSALIKADFLVMKSIYRVNKLFHAYFKKKIAKLYKYYTKHDTTRAEIKCSSPDIAMLKSRNKKLYKTLARYGCFYLKSLGNSIFHGKQSQFSFSNEYVMFYFGKIISISSSASFIIKKYLDHSGQDIYGFNHDRVHISFYPQFLYQSTTNDDVYQLVITSDYALVWDKDERGRPIILSQKYYYKNIDEEAEKYWEVYHKSLKPYESLSRWFKEPIM